MGIKLSRLIRDLFANKKNARILMVGLDGAGKTTITYKMKLGEVVPSIPTIGFKLEEITYKNVSFTVWDVGGQDRIRPLWRHYFNGVNGIIFVVDSNDVARLDEAREELHRLLAEEQLQDAVLLVYANKVDLPKAKSVQNIATSLELHKLTNRRWFIQASCATKGEGLFEGMHWLAEAV